MLIAEFIRRLLVIVSILGAAFTFSGLIGGLLGRHHFIFDMCSHFRLQAIVALLLCGIINMTLARRKFLGGAVFASGLLLAGTLAPYFPRKAPVLAAHNQSLRLLVFNVYTGNPMKTEVARYILDKNPDIAILLETDLNWIASMDSHLDSLYPHQIKRARSDNFGIAAYSRIPFLHSQIIDYGGQDLPSVNLILDIGEGKSFRIIGIHPLPPVSSRYWRLRNIQLQSVAEEALESSVPLVVCGDFNSTPWSPFFKDFLKVSQLRLASFHRGISPTWTGKKVYALGLPIDHVCLSAGTAVIDRVVGPSLGSDHRPVIVDFKP